MLPNSNSCLGEPGLEFFGFTCTALTLLVRTRLSGKPGVFCSSKGRKCGNALNAQNDKATSYIADILYNYIAATSYEFIRNHTKSSFDSSLLLPDQVKNIMFAQQFLFQNNAEYLHLSPPAVSEVHQLHVHSADALDRNPQSWLQVAACSAATMATFKFQLRPFRAHKVACTSPAKSSSLDNFEVLCYPVACLSALFTLVHTQWYSVHSRDGRCLWQALLQLVRFPDSALWFLLQVLERHKSGNATNQAKFVQNMFKSKCRHLWAFQVSQDNPR